MTNDRTIRVMRAFEKYIDARFEYVLGQRRRQETGDVTLDPELADKQHRSDVARMQAAEVLDRAIAPQLTERQRNKLAELAAVDAKRGD